MRAILPWLLVALLPLASAHSSPTILDVEVQAIEDEANDLTYTTDGYDLQSLHARAVHWRSAATDGLMFRVIATGGAVTPVAAERAIEVDVSIAGAVDTYRFTTSDDVTWSGDLDVIEQNNVVGDAGETTANFQFLLPTPTIEDGALIGEFAMRSYVGDQLVDAAPGGLYGPGGELPNSGGSTIADPYAWEGPVGYTETTVTRTEEGATLDVANLITVSGQHVTIRVGDADGWGASIVGDLAASVDPGQDLQFDLRITAIGEESLAIEVLTDIGGREVVVLPGQTDDPDQPMPTDSDGADPVGEESPGLGLVGVLALLALAIRRSR